MDAITLEVMRNRFFAITEEMGAALIRTAYSTNIKDRRDCSCALFNVDGDTIAQAEHIPVHSGVLPWGVKGALKYIDKSALKPGDAIMHNDPFMAVRICLTSSFSRPSFITESWSRLWEIWPTMWTWAERSLVHLLPTPPKYSTKESAFPL